MPSMSAQSEPLIEGKLYDGVTAHAHDVRVVIADDRLELSQDGGWRDNVYAARLKRIDSGPAGLRIGRTDLGGWRLLLPAEAESALARLLGRHERYGRWIDRVGLVPALIVG